MTWLHPLGILGLLAVPVLIALSLWRWRRRELSVSSLLLWREVAALARAASRSERRRRVDPLLVVRVAVALALTAALCAPAWVRIEARARRLILVLDLSASMATRRPDARTRWEACRDGCLAALGRLSAADRVEVVAVPAPAEGAAPGELTPAEASALLRRLAPSEEPVRPRDLSEAATAAARRHPGASVVLATDERPDGLPQGIAVLAAGGPTDNRGIVAFAARFSASPDAPLEVLVGVGNAAEGPVSVDVELLADGREAGRQRLDVPARGRSQTIFQGAFGGATQLEARLAGSDGLAADDRAWLVRRARPVRVALIGETHYYLRRALSAQQGVEVRELIEAPEGSASGPLTPQASAVAEWDLAVYYRAVPKQLKGQVVLVAPIEPVGGLEPGEVLEAAEATVVAPADPLMQSVELAGVRLGAVARVASPEGFESLARAGDVPLIGRWRVGEAALLYVGIDPARSDWPLRASFPIFWANVLAGCAGAGPAPGEFLCTRPGQVRPVGLRAQRLTLLRPDGSRAGKLSGDAFRPDRVGLYRVEDERGREDLCAVSLLSEAETLASGTSVPLPAGFLGESEQSATARTVVPLTGWLALVGLVLVLLHDWTCKKPGHQ